MAPAVSAQTGVDRWQGRGPGEIAQQGLGGSVVRGLAHCGISQSVVGYLSQADSGEASRVQLESMRIVSLSKLVPPGPNTDSGVVRAGRYGVVGDLARGVRGGGRRHFRDFRYLSPLHQGTCPRVCELFEIGYMKAQTTLTHHSHTSKAPLDRRLREHGVGLRSLDDHERWRVLRATLRWFGGDWTGCVPGDGFPETEETPQAVACGGTEMSEARDVV